MRNFQYDELPKQWQNYYGQGHAVTLASIWIRGGASKLPRSLFISGKSGTGKTSFVKLLMRSFRCLDREPSSYEPCGKCAACLDLDERLADRTQTDVYWVQPGGYNDDETLGKQVKTALAAAAKGHRRTNRPSHDVLWVVFDEWQNFPINLRQEILIRSELEVPGNNVCYCFVTMQEERLTEEDRIALMSRGIPLKFKAFRPEEVAQFLQERYSTEASAANLIATASNGSIRMAQAYLDLAGQLDPTLSISAIAKVTGCAPDSWRWELWQSLQDRIQFVELRRIVSAIQEFVDKDTLVRQMIDDLLYSIDISGVPTQDQQFALYQLTSLQSGVSCDPMGYLATLAGIKLVQEAAILRNSTTPYGLER